MDEIYELTTYGGGGFTWNEVYNMPIQVRKYNLKKLIQDKENQLEANKKSQTKGQTMTMKDLVKPSKNLDYTTKASRK